MKDFFISYNKADKSWAEWIAWQLEEADYTTVLQAWDFGAGSNFVLEMQKAATEAERTVAVLSPDYLASQFTAPEWAAAFAQDPVGTGRKLVPIRVRECNPSGLLGSIVYQDIAGLDERAAKQALLAAVKAGRSKPDTAPAFPLTTVRAVTSQPRFPGSLPAVWNVPHLRNPNFTGRENLFQELRALLAPGKDTALIQAIYGLGGVGKTQIAVEYAYRYASDYSTVLWIAAEDQATLASQFAALADEIGLGVDTADQPAKIAAVKRWLRDQTRWLLVFDNAPSVAAIQLYLPHGNAAHVIITSRNPEWRSTATPLEVQRFTRDEAVMFLLKRAGRDAADEDERAAAAILADELGGLALALEQAAAYAETHAQSFEEYLRLFHRHHERVLSAEVSPAYPHTIETVWSLSFEAVRREAPAAIELLSLLAFAAPDVPLALLQGGATALSGALAELAQDELQLHEGLRTLRKHSFVRLEGAHLSIHRVVQSVTRRSLSAVERRTWARIAMGVVNAALPDDPNDVGSWPRFSELTSQVDVAARHCEADAVAMDIASDCLNRTGRYLGRRADFASARDYLERALRLAERVFGPHDPNVAGCLNNLGLTQQALGASGDARKSFERALQIDERALGPDHPNVARDAHNLAGLLNSLGEFGHARAYYQRALAIIQTVHGPTHPIAALIYNNLGIVAQTEGDLRRECEDSQGARESYELARENYEQALALDEAELGPNHPNVARDLSNLSTVLHALGDTPRALALIQRGLAIDEAVFGPSHHTVATRLFNLAHVQEALGDTAGAGMSRSRAERIGDGRSGHNIMNISHGV